MKAVITICYTLSALVVLAVAVALAFGFAAVGAVVLTILPYAAAGLLIVSFVVYAVCTIIEESFEKWREARKKPAVLELPFTPEAKLFIIDPVTGNKTEVKIVDEVKIRDRVCDCPNCLQFPYLCDRCPYNHPGGGPEEEPLILEGRAECE